MNTKSRDKILFMTISVISLLAMILSVTIYLEKVTNNATVNNICSVLSSQSQCQTVQSSKYARIFGIDNPVYGIIGFTALMILSWMYYRTGDVIAKRLAIIGSIIPGLFAIWFLYLQTFVIDAYCIFCVIVDTLSIIMMILGIYLLVRYIKDISTSNSQK